MENVVADIPPNLRYERKHRVEHVSAALVTSLVLRHPALFREIYAKRTVCSIYFDTPDFALFASNVRGDAHRSKYRVRWYGCPLAEVAGAVLERKRKFGLAGSKDVVALPDLTLALGWRGDRLQDALRSARLSPELHAGVCRVQPRLLCSYARRYFLSCDGRFRVTIDSEISFREVGLGVNRLRHERRDQAVIVEVKYGLDDDADAARICGVFPFALTRNSKYVVGTSLLYPHLAD